MILGADTQKINNPNHAFISKITASSFWQSTHYFRQNFTIISFNQPFFGNLLICPALFLAIYSFVRPFFGNLLICPAFFLAIYSLVRPFFGNILVLITKTDDRMWNTSTNFTQIGRKVIFYGDISRNKSYSEQKNMRIWVNCQKNMRIWVNCHFSNLTDST